MAPPVALQDFERINDEVYYARSPLCTVTRRTIDELRSVALGNPRGKARICFHASPEARLHDMLIVLRRGSASETHMHARKTEAFHVIEGRLRIVLFSDRGEVETSVELGGLPGADAAGDPAFYFRIPMGRYHAVVPLTETVVFREVTDGPFVPSETAFAPWAVPEGLA